MAIKFTKKDKIKTIDFLKKYSFDETTPFSNDSYKAIDAVMVGTMGFYQHLNYVDLFMHKSLQLPQLSFETYPLYTPFANTIDFYSLQALDKYFEVSNTADSTLITDGVTVKSQMYCKELDIGGTELLVVQLQLYQLSGQTYTVNILYGKGVTSLYKFSNMFLNVDVTPDILDTVSFLISLGLLYCYAYEITSNEENKVNQLVFTNSLNSLDSLEVSRGFKFTYQLPAKTKQQDTDYFQNFYLFSYKNKSSDSFCVLKTKYQAEFLLSNDEEMEGSFLLRFHLQNDAVSLILTLKFLNFNFEKDYWGYSKEALKEIQL